MVAMQYSNPSLPQPTLLYACRVPTFLTIFKGIPSSWRLWLQRRSYITATIVVIIKTLILIRKLDLSMLIWLTTHPTPSQCKLSRITIWISSLFVCSLIPKPNGCFHSMMKVFSIRVRVSPLVMSILARSKMIFLISRSWYSVAPMDGTQWTGEIHLWYLSRLRCVPWCLTVASFPSVSLEGNEYRVSNHKIKIMPHRCLNTVSLQLISHSIYCSVVPFTSPWQR